MLQNSCVASDECYSDKLRAEFSKYTVNVDDAASTGMLEMWYHVATGNMAPRSQLYKSAKEINTKGLRVGHININGLLNKLHELKYPLQLAKFDIFAVSETHLSKEIKMSK